MAKDVFHYIVKEALEKDGWIITQDPLLLTDKSMKIDYEIDLGAEKLLAAEKENEKIAVEVKSFLKTSLLNEFHSVLGQYLVYQKGLLRLEPDRLLYLAIPHFAEVRLADYKFLQELIADYHLKIIVFDEENHSILQWKN
ncbi:MAG: hypothetical protein MUE85_17150 [Microscillaceae bacterium]|jgi:hypothetical protein|nr:hypothetical protein [Microscillaceae bacterium]